MCVGGRCVLSGFEQKNPDKLYSIIQIQATIETAVALRHLQKLNISELTIFEKTLISGKHKRQKMNFWV